MARSVTCRSGNIWGPGGACLSRAEFIRAAGTTALGTSALAAAAFATTAVLPSAACAAGAPSGASEDNKALKFADIPKEALVSVHQLHALIEDEMSLEDIMAGVPAPEPEPSSADGEPQTAPAPLSKVPVPATTKPGKMDTMRFTEFMLLDIRSHRDYSKRLINGSRNIPAGRQIDIRIDEIPTDKPVFLIAAKNTDRLAETRQTLIDDGRDPELLRVVDGGVNAWAQAGYPTLQNQFLGC